MTRPVNTPSISAFPGSILGRACVVERRDNDWVFALGDNAIDGCVITAASWWRLIGQGRIIHAVKDDGHQFGLPAPVDVMQETNQFLDNRAVTDVVMDPISSDLTLALEGDVRLQILVSSGGYESWQAHFRTDGRDVTVIAGGGGQLSFVGTPAGSRPAVVHGHELPSGRAGG